MKRLLFLLMAALFLASCVNIEREVDDENITMEAEAPTDGIFIHISHGYDDPHRVAMALQMANMMSEDKDVAVYIDITGVMFVLKDAEDISYSHFPSAHTAIQNLIEKGVPVMVCPGCLKAAGKSEEDVMDGVMIADKKKFFNFTEGRILTIDY
jgi:predicted peroxiredoxin